MYKCKKALSIIGIFVVCLFVGTFLFVRIYGSTDKQAHVVSSLSPPGSPWKSIEIQSDTFKKTVTEFSAFHEAPFSGSRKKKMSIIDDALILADDLTDEVALYRYAADTMEYQATKKLPHGCTIAFAQSDIIAIYSDRVESYNRELEKIQSTPIALNSSFVKEPAAIWTATAIDRDSVAWICHDRSACITNIRSGEDTEIDVVIDDNGRKALFSSIMLMGDAPYLLLSGSVYGADQDASVATAFAYFLVDIHTGEIVDISYIEDLKRENELLSPGNCTRYHFSQGTNLFAFDALIERTGDLLANSGFIESFSDASTDLEIWDLEGNQTYLFPESTRGSFSVLSACRTDTRNIFLLTDCGENDHNYLVSI